MGVVQHDNAPADLIPEKQPQQDVLCSSKQAYMNNSQLFTCKFEWVEVHSVEYKGWRNCSVKERMNLLVDDHAKAALRYGIASGKFIDSAFPSKNISVKNEG